MTYDEYKISAIRNGGYYLKYSDSIHQAAQRGLILNDLTYDELSAMFSLLVSEFKVTPFQWMVGELIKANQEIK